MLRYLVDDLAWVPMKGVASCDMPRGGASDLRSEDSLMGLPIARKSDTPLGVGTLRTETSY